MEIIGNRELTYVYAGGTPFAIHEKNGNDEQLYYLHLDYQGSIRAITDEAGAVVETRDYDAWGRPRNANTLEYTATNPFSVSTITNRGYTFHEHIYEFSLINMNARMYDPVLRRVISPDNLIPDPDNTQAYNRYTYCYNNPLKYIDPDGNEPITIAILIGVKLAAKVAAKVAVNAATKKTTAVVAKKVATKYSTLTAATTSGTVNVINNTNFERSGWGWEAAGHFASGFIGGYLGAEVGSAYGFVVAGSGTFATDAMAGDINSTYDAAQSFIGGGLSGMLGAKISKKALGAEAKSGLKYYMKSGAKNAGEAWASAFAFDKEDKFLTKPWYTHAGVLAAGFANGFAMGMFDGNKEFLFQKTWATDDILQSITDFGVKSLGATAELGLTSYAKYGKIRTEGFGKKGGKAFLKNLGFVLVTYY